MLVMWLHSREILLTEGARKSCKLLFYRTSTTNGIFHLHEVSRIAFDNQESLGQPTRVRFAQGQPFCYSIAYSMVSPRDTLRRIGQPYCYCTFTYPVTMYHSSQARSALLLLSHTLWSVHVSDIRMMSARGQPYCFSKVVARYSSSAFKRSSQSSFNVGAGPRSGTNSKVNLIPAKKVPRRTAASAGCFSMKRL